MLASVPAIRWYFSRGFGNLFTIPFFLLLLALFMVSVWGAFIKGMAFVKVTWAVYGIVGVVGLVALSWLWFIIILGSPIVYFLLLTYPAAAWTDLSIPWLRRLGNIVFVILAGLLIAWCFHFITVSLIAWIADHNVCAALEAGVTGSLPPIDCDKKTY